MVTDDEVIGPTSNDYRVAPGALRQAVSGLETLLYEESIETGEDDGERVASARIVARKMNTVGVSRQMDQKYPSVRVSMKSLRSS